MNSGGWGEGGSIRFEVGFRGILWDGGGVVSYVRFEEDVGVFICFGVG